MFLLACIICFIVLILSLITWKYVQKNLPPVPYYVLSSDQVKGMIINVPQCAVCVTGGVFIPAPLVKANKEYEARGEDRRQFNLGRRTYTLGESRWCEKSGLALRIWILVGSIGKCEGWVNRYRSCNCSVFAHAHTHNADRKTPGRKILMITWMGQGHSWKCLSVLCAAFSLGDFLALSYFLF